MTMPRKGHDTFDKTKFIFPTPRIIHISDTHFTSSAKTLDTGYWIDSQHSQLRSDVLSDYIINNQAQLGANIIVITGDLTDSGDESDYKIARTFIEKLKNNGFEVYCIPGNHDYSFEGNLFAGQQEPGQSLTRKGNFSKYVNSGVYPQFVDLNNCCLILLDSLQGDVDDSGHSLNIDLNAQGKLGNAQLARLTTKLVSDPLNNLQKARQAGKKVIVCLHHSPFQSTRDNLPQDSGMTTDALSGLDDAQEFMAAINNNIDCLLFGHTSPTGELQQGSAEFAEQAHKYSIPIVNCENLEHLAWYKETGLGGSAKQVCVGRNQDGRLEVFYIGTDNKIYHNWQTTLETDWHKVNWQGEVALGGEAQQICVGQNKDGRLEIFYIGTNSTIYHNWQNGPNRSDSWHGQAVLGHSWTGDDSARQICAGQNKDGRLEVFYVGTDLRIRHNWQNAPDSSESWHGEERFGLIDTGYQICAGQNQDGRLEVFYIGTNLEIYHNWQKTDGGWSGETSFGTHIFKDTAFQICVGQNKDGRLEIFYVGINLQIYHNWQVVPNGNWHGEVSFGKHILENTGYQICVGQNKDGRLEIFYVGTNLFIYHNYQKTPNGLDWAGEELLGGLSEAGQQICAGMNFDGRFEVFYVGTNFQLFHNFQTIPNAAYPITVIDLDRNQSEVYNTDSTTPVTVTRGFNKPKSHFNQYGPKGRH